MEFDIFTTMLSNFGKPMLNEFVWKKTSCGGCASVYGPVSCLGIARKCLNLEERGG